MAGLGCRQALVALAIASAGIAAGVGAQVAFINQGPVAKFVDGEEGRPYVLGFASGTGEEPPMWPHRAMLMRSANGTRYRCYLPVEEGGDEGGSGAAGSSSAAAGSVAKQGAQATQGSLSQKRKPTDLLEALAEHCYYHYEEWWTYELCYRKHVRQYRKRGDNQVEIEYLLGIHDELEQAEDEDAIQVDTSDVSGGMRYITQLYSEGEECDLTGQPRQVEVRFTCGADAGGTRLLSIKEPASCAYVLTVATPRLCKHPAFAEQPQAASLIRCHPLGEGGGAAAAAVEAPGSCGAAPGSSCAAAAGGGNSSSGSGSSGLVDDPPPGLSAAVLDLAGETDEYEGYDDDDDGGDLLSQLMDGEDDEDDPYY
ncbi:endoplasmic reticulum lectin 1-like isoform B [Micractinium conductrix]|uniref:Endoplasmic reticulum lectin 1-like isoform B n=1 Tax=Micractinium conductrix TaxID=554055 RepID=A0A2P6VDF4_9CHLO|nr:endoplasmic reticulum lectin 1-like isoform B [Micractinium conductrix]|eukprot:PSC72091.1 endoplasmic reticulum lectin 1-like isoform B [Micractinium conductrix]